MNAMLVKHLKDFGAPQAATALEADEFFTGSDSLVFPALAASAFLEPQVSVEVLCDLAKQEGHQAATVELGACHETELATLQAVHAGEINDLRELYENQIAGLVADRFDSLARELADTVSANVMTLLLPLIEEQVALKSVDDLATSIRLALAEQRIAEIVIKGPVNLFEGLAIKIADLGISCRHADAAGIDLSVEIDKAVLLTRLAVWKDGLAEIMAEATA